MTPNGSGKAPQQIKAMEALFRFNEAAMELSALDLLHVMREAIVGVEGIDLLCIQLELAQYAAHLLKRERAGSPP